MALKNIKKLDEFKNELKGKTIVMFYADWCGPCQMVKPIIIELSSDFNVLMINTEESSELVQEFKINSIPTIKLYNNENLIKEFTGFVTKELILETFK